MSSRSAPAESARLLVKALLSLGLAVVARDLGAGTRAPQVEAVEADWLR